MIEYSQTLVGRTIIGSLERGSKNFDKLLEICHSIFPDELQSILNGMVIAKLIRKIGNEYVLDDSIPNRWNKTQTDWQENLDKAYKTLSMIMDNIHLPHCLDYEWWFTHTSREDLAYKIINRNLLPVPKCIVFLGSPLLGAFISLLVPETEVYILDKS